MFKYLLAASLFVCSYAYSQTWQPLYACHGNSGVLVIDTETENSNSLQFVIRGTSAVNYIAMSMKGYQVSLPGNIRVYEDGNVLVVSGSTLLDVNPSQRDFYRVQVDITVPGRAILSWRTPAEQSRRENWVFYNCR